MTAADPSMSKMNEIPLATKGGSIHDHWHAVPVVNIGQVRLSRAKKSWYPEKMKLLIYLFLAALIFHNISAWACSPIGGDIYEPHEGNSLTHATAGQIGLATVLFSSVGTVFESDETNKVSAYIGLLGSYFVMCNNSTGYPNVQDKKYFDNLDKKRNPNRKFIPKPNSTNEIALQKKRFYEQQAKYDRLATALSFLVNIANGVSAKKDINKGLGYGGAAINLGYYLLDLNGVRSKKTSSINAYVAPTPTGFFAVTEFSF
jgi:hypothetical protein